MTRDEIQTIREICEKEIESLEKKMTKDELRTICWMCEKEAAHILMTAATEHRKMTERENEKRNRIISISKKAYNRLVND